MVNSVWRDDIVESAIIAPRSFSETLLSGYVLFFRHILLLGLAPITVHFASLLPSFSVQTSVEDIASSFVDANDRCVL